jgi:putative hemolysin
MVRQVFRLGDRRARSLMTRRAEIAWLDVADPPEEIRRKITESPHSRFPVCEGGLDNVLGIVQVKDLLIRAYAGRPFDIKGLLIVPLFIYEGATGLKVLELFKTTGTHVAMVLDEYGCIEGLLTLNDILEAIVGDLAAGTAPDEPMVVPRPDGSWLLDGTLAIDQFREQFSLAPCPRATTDRGRAGHHAPGHIPRAADGFEWGGFRFEVVDMDANRVDKILLNPLPQAGPPEPEPSSRRSIAVRAIVPSVALPCVCPLTRPALILLALAVRPSRPRRRDAGRFRAVPRRPGGGRTDFTKDIAPILYRQCVSCHRPGRWRRSRC